MLFVSESPSQTKLSSRASIFQLQVETQDFFNNDSGHFGFLTRENYRHQFFQYEDLFSNLQTKIPFHVHIMSIKLLH